MLSVRGIILILATVLVSGCGSHFRPTEPEPNTEPEPCTGPGCVGDINYDGIAFTIADAVMFSNYFLYGPGAFPAGKELISTNASDMNGDGIKLGVADLAYIIRVVIGDADLEVGPGWDPVSTRYTYVHRILTVENEMRTAYLVFDGDVRVELLAENMEMKYDFDGSVTRAVVYSFDGHTFEGNVVSATNLMSVEFGSVEGAAVNASLWTVGSSL